MFLDPRVGAVVYGAKVTCLGAVDHGAEPRYLNGVAGRCGANVAGLGAVDYVIGLGFYSPLLSAISRASTLSSISKTARLAASCTSCHSPEHSPSIS